MNRGTSGLSIGGSKFEHKGSVPVSVQFLSFSCSFQLKICQIIGWHPSPLTLVPPLGNPRSAIDISVNIFTCTIFQYSTRAIVNTCPIPVCSLLWVVQYMLNDALINPGAYTNGYSILAPLCVLQNGGVPECYTVHSI